MFQGNIAREGLRWFSRLIALGLAVSSCWGWLNTWPGIIGLVGAVAACICTLYYVLAGAEVERNGVGETKLLTGLFVACVVFTGFSEHQAWDAFFREGRAPYLQYVEKQAAYDAAAKAVSDLDGEIAVQRKISCDETTPTTRCNNLLAKAAEKIEELNRLRESATAKVPAKAPDKVTAPTTPHPGLVWAFTALFAALATLTTPALRYCHKRAPEGASSPQVIPFEHKGKTLNVADPRVRGGLKKSNPHLFVKGGPLYFIPSKPRRKPRPKRAARRTARAPA